MSVMKVTKRLLRRETDLLAETSPRKIKPAMLLTGQLLLSQILLVLHPLMVFLKRVRSF